MLPDHLGTTKQEAATAMRRLEETAVAAMVGWAKAAAEVERLTAERDALKAEVADRGKAIADWQHACGQHQAALFDMKAERDEARAALARVRELREHYRSSDDVVDGDLRAAELDTAIDGSGTSDTPKHQLHDCRDGTCRLCWGAGPVCVECGDSRHCPVLDGGGT